MAAAGEPCSKRRAIPDHRSAALHNDERAARDRWQRGQGLGWGDGRGDGDGVDDFRENDIALELEHPETSLTSFDKLLT